MRPTFWQAYEALSPGVQVRWPASPADFAALESNLRPHDLQELVHGRADALRRGVSTVPLRSASVWIGADLVGIWSSCRMERGPANWRGWGWLTSNAVNRHRLTYVRAARRFFRFCWDRLEDPSVAYASVAVIEEYEACIKWIRRCFPGAVRVAAIEVDGKREIVFSFGRGAAQEQEV